MHGTKITKVYTISRCEGGVRGNLVFCSGGKIGNEFRYHKQVVFLKADFVLSGKKAEHFKQVLETRIAELNRVLATAEQETRASAVRHADPADQAAAEYERQSLVHKSNTARQMLRTLTQALERIRQGSFGECATCGADIEPKRLEVIPARYCVKCQEAREEG